MTQDNAARVARRRFMAGLGLAVTVGSVAGMMLGDWTTDPWWVSPAINAAVIFVAFYPLRYLAAPGGRSTMPDLPALVVTALLSAAASALVVVPLANGTPAYLFAGAAILAVWLTGAWWVGRGSDAGTGGG